MSKNQKKKREKKDIYQEINFSIQKINEQQENEWLKDAQTFWASELEELNYNTIQLLKQITVRQQ